jgi:N-methylhydantoinase A
VQYIIGVDIGGTGTDCVAINQNGDLTLGKVLSTPPDFSQGVMDALQIIANEIGIKLTVLLQNTKLFIHATTVAENAIVDGDLAKGGLIMTAGFEDALFMQRGAYGRWSGLTEMEKKNPVETDKPISLLPRDMVLGIRERTDFQGNILIKADMAEIENAVNRLMSKGAKAVGVCFLWSPVNPENEILAGKIIKRLYPKCFYTLSHEITSSLGEYERSSTVALNIGLGDRVSKYLNNLSKNLKNKGFKGKILIMQAHGGLAEDTEIYQRPVSIIESGPVSGLVGSKSLGETIGCQNIIAADMGGTTFKAGVIREGTIEYQREPTVVRYHYALPKMDVVSIGLAGGSIISLDRQLNRPKVGPNSAGSYPGPVCYDFGGEEPTVTDIDIILGYLNSEYFLGGRKKLNAEKAYQIFKQKIADPLGGNVIDIAASIYKLINNILYDLLHKLTVEKGMDPRHYALFSYGGTAGMHVGHYGDMLNVNQIVIPHSASVHGAFGLLTADILHEYQKNLPMKMPVDVIKINDIFKDLESQAYTELGNEGFNKDEIVLSRSIDMRYSRQVHIITTPIENPGKLAETDVEKMCKHFEELYENRYGEGSAYKDAGMYMTVFRLRAAGLLKKIKMNELDLSKAEPSSAYIETKKIFIHNLGQNVDTRCYDFIKLLPGNRVEGPAIIWTPITTVAINANQEATLDKFKNIIIRRI